MAWFVYLIECVDGSLYTGIAVDVDARYAAHARGKGARYTRAHPPARLLARFAYADRSAASKAEYAIKQLSPAAKRALCANGAPPQHQRIPRNRSATRIARLRQRCPRHAPKPTPTGSCSRRDDR